MNKTLGLRDKTQKKFIEFFEKMVHVHGSNEFEIAYSEIQRGTGSANTTLKRALNTLTEEGVIAMSPGRNSRYARVTYLLAPEKSTPNPEPAADMLVPPIPNMTSDQPENKIEKEELKEHEDIQELSLDIKELTYLVENLRRRMRTQEMTIALLQDRLAELEDKLHKR